MDTTPALRESANLLASGCIWALKLIQTHIHTYMYINKTNMKSMHCYCKEIKILTRKINLEIGQQTQIQGEAVKLEL